MSVSRHPFLPFMLMFFLGAIAILGFAPFNISILTPLSFAAFLYLLAKRQQQGLSCYKLAWLYGLGYYGFGLYWLYISIHYFGGTNTITSLLITLAAQTLMSLWFLVIAWVVLQIYKRCQSTLLTYTIVLPTALALINLLQLFYPFGGMPWLLPGYCLSNTAIAQLASVFGVLGLCWLVYMIASWLCFIALNASQLKAWKPYVLWLLVVVFSLNLVGLLISKIQWTTKINQINIALVQGNIPITLKWDTNVAKANLAIYKHLSAHLPKQTLIIWPESAITFYPSQILPWLNTYDKALKAKGQGLISGIPMAFNNNYYNAAIAVGNAKGEYLKHHLVPFGEYFPLAPISNIVLDVLQIPMSDFSPGPLQQKLIRFGPYKIATYICYEIAFPWQVASTSKQANLLVNISDDAWFGQSFARDQQLQMAKIRAIENGKTVVAATNNGLTAVISNKGRILSSIKADQRQVLLKRVALYQGETPFSAIATIFLSPQNA